MKCPRDRAVLAFADDGRHMRNKCPDCRGILLGDDEIGEALGNRAGNAPAVLDAERVAALAPSGLKCPRDEQPMRRFEHRGVELDLCPECRALWLDAGELEKIAALKGKRPGRKTAALAGAAALAGGAAVAAAAADKPSMVAGLAEAAGEVAVSGAIDLAFEFVGEAVGALLDGLF